MTTDQLVYSTTTGSKSVCDNLSVELQEELGLIVTDDPEYDPFADEMEFYYEWCHVCSRPTDHRGEHDDLVEAGQASYDPRFPSVYLTR